MPAKEFLILAVATAALTALIVEPRDGPCLPDEADYWQLAKSIRSGRGLATRIVRPLELCTHEADLFTDISRPPAFPYLVALQRMISDDRWVPWIPIGRISFVLFALSQWLLGYTLGGRTAGRVAWVLILCNAWYGFYASVLLSELVFCFLTALLILSLIHRESRNICAVVTGLLLAVCFYTKAVAALYLPAVGLALWIHRRQYSYILLVVAAATLPVVPWLFRMWDLTGSPFLAFNSLQLPMFTETWPGYSLFRSVNCISPLEFVRHHPVELLQKWWHGLALGIRGVVSYTSLGVLAFAAVAPFFSRGSSTRRLWYMAGACCVMFLVVLPLYEPRTRHYLPLTVWLIPLSAVSIATLWSGGTLGTRTMGGIVLFFIVWHHVAAHSSIPHIVPMELERGAEEVLQALPDGTIVATDAPWLIAMATPHRSIWLPQDIHAWQRCRQSLPAMKAVYVTTGLLRWSSDQRPVWWETMLQSGGSFDDLGNPMTFPDGSRLWMVGKRSPQEQR
jgi:hypothetical protein